MRIAETALFQQGGYAAVAIAAVVIILATAIVAQLLVVAFNHGFKRNRDGERAGSIFTIIIRAVVWGAGIAIALKACLGFDVSIIWGALGVGGIALSLGLQSTISNLIGGLFVSFGKDFAIGDWIEVGSIGGIVKDINWRSAVIEDDAGRVHTVPNSVLNSTTVTRYPEYFRVPLSIVISRDADTDALAPVLCALADEALGSKEMRFGDKKAALAFTGLDASGIAATLVVFAKWDFTAAQVADTALPPVAAYLKENNLLAHWA